MAHHTTGPRLLKTVTYVRLDDGAASLAPGDCGRNLQHGGYRRFFGLFDGSHRTGSAPLSGRRLCAAIAPWFRRRDHKPMGVRARYGLGTRRTVQLGDDGMGTCVDRTRCRRSARAANDGHAARDARGAQDGLRKKVIGAQFIGSHADFIRIFNGLNRFAMVTLCVCFRWIIDQECS
jgi:hypothetical protein